MTCKEALEKLYEVIDKEATEIDTQEVEKHLNHCKSCMARYQFEAMFKTFVTDRVPSECTGDLLKSKIMGQIDREDDASTRFSLNPFKYKAVLISAAAALVIAIGAAYFSSEFYRHKTYIYPFEQSHFAYVNGEAGVTHDDAMEDSVSRFIHNELHLAMGENNTGYTMTSCCFNDVQGQKFAHLMFNRGSTYVSLFIGNNDGVSLPDFQKSVFAGKEYFERICSDCQLIYWRHGDVLLIAVSHDKTAELTSFIPALDAI
jgi:mycothiol system anti-sigma-R factor